MEKRALRDVRMLIVEDEPDSLEPIKRGIELIEEKLRQQWGINSFQANLAGSVEKAEDFLKAANPAFDIMTLDLGLPLREGGLPHRDNGQRLLEKIKKDKAKEVIIISILSEYADVITTIRKGAVDFINKPFLRKMLQTRVMEAWKRVLEQESAHILQERIKELALYHERGLAYRYTVSFGEFVSDIHRKTGEMEEHVNHRFGLNRKTGLKDPLIKSLVWLKERIDKAKQSWMKLQVPSLPKLPEDDVPTAEDVEPMLYELERELMPCLVVKNVRLNILPISNPRIITFQKDVKAVLKEILSGLMAKLPDYGPARNGKRPDDDAENLYNLITIEISTGNKYAKVKVTDNLTDIPADAAQQINAGSFTVSDQPFSRVWGLSVMQHIAALGGGRLEIESREQGNVITFMIPLESNA